MITNPNDPAFEPLLERLRRSAGDLESDGRWPEQQLTCLGEAGVYRWFLPSQWGGVDWPALDVLGGYLALSSACLTTTFILTQRTGACRRIAASRNEELKRRLLPDLADGTTFATVGISHLTTSRQHLRQPVLRAQAVGDGFVLNGYSPWITGAAHAQTLVVGATLPEGDEVLLAVPASMPGVRPGVPQSLTALSSSHTGRVDFSEVRVPGENLLSGPVKKVLLSGGAATGGLQTSALALGLATSAVGYIQEQSADRPDLEPPAEQLTKELDGAKSRLIELATDPQSHSPDELRADANSLALRASQSALAAAKGAGFVHGHPAGRWCREALFFLVWSCPRSVVDANLCEFSSAGAR